MGPQRIGWFGPNGGGIATLPPRPVDPGVFGLPGGPVPIPEQPQDAAGGSARLGQDAAAAQAAQAAQMLQHPVNFAPNTGGNILTALAALHGGRLGSPQPSLHNLLAAAAAAHPQRPTPIPPGQVPMIPEYPGGPMEPAGFLQLSHRPRGVPRAQVGRGLTEPTQLYHNPQTHLYPQLHANSGGAGY